VPSVQFLGDVLEVFGSVGAHVGAFGKVLAQHSLMLPCQAVSGCRLMLCCHDAKSAVIARWMTSMRWRRRIRRAPRDPLVGSWRLAAHAARACAALTDRQSGPEPADGEIFAFPGPRGADKTPRCGC
jgi:hypothetical protein